MSGTPTAPRSSARSTNPAAATPEPRAGLDPAVGTPASLPTTAAARTATANPPAATRPARLRKPGTVGREASASGPAPSAGTTACNGPESPPQNASAPGAAAPSSDGRLAPLPNGINASRGPSQSRGNGTTLFLVPASWPPRSVFRPSVSNPSSPCCAPSLAHLQSFSAKQRPVRLPGAVLYLIELVPVCLN